MKDKLQPKYPLVWRKDDFFIKIFCSIPNLATGILLTTDKAVLVIDPGDGILRDLNKEIGTQKIIEVSDIFISHGHHDHVGGMWSLLTYLNVMGKKDPLNVYYPDSCVEIESIYKAFTEVYFKELNYKINLNPINNSQTFQRKGVRIKPFKVDHREPSSDGRSIEVPSLGFKFYYKDKSICYGGDTAYTESLVRMAKDSDLAIIEAGAEDNDESADIHMTFSQAIKIGNTAEEYFLVHVPE